MMKKVSQTENELSRFVVNMVGCVTVEEPMLLLVEFVRYGNLLSFLRATRKVRVRTYEHRYDQMRAHKLFLAVDQ